MFQGVKRTAQMIDAGDGDRERIAKVLEAARAKTSVEIVPVVVRHCSRYERATDVLGLFVALLASLVLLGFYPDAHPPLYLVLPVQGVGFLMGALLLGRIDGLRFILAGRAVMSQRVRRHANEYFTGLGIEGASGRMGLLIFCAQFERQVVVVADPQLSAKLKPDGLTEIKNLLLKGLQEGQTASGWCKGLERCGNLLADVFPSASS